MIKAILFDMDGVLVDSESLSVDIGVRYFESEGYHLEAKDFYPHLGTGPVDFFTGPAVDRHVGNWSLERADEFFRKYYETEALKAGIAMDGAARVLESCRKAGIQIAVCSSAQEWKIDANLKALGVDRSYFDLVVSGNEIKRNKPHGDIYKLALLHLGLEPEEAIVIEDSFGGIESGKDAGIRTVGLMTTINGELASQAGADAIISDIDTLPDFRTAEELETFLFYPEDIDRRVKYGVNYVHPLERKYPENYILNKAIEKAKRARDNAHAPYSNYHVGAAIVSAATGRIYAGCNVENSSYGGTICAERNAITTAVAEEGNLGIDLLVVVSDDNPPAPPCALCLQVIAEFAKEDTRVVLEDMKGHRYEYLFRDLLPHPFIMPALR